MGKTATTLRGVPEPPAPPPIFDVFAPNATNTATGASGRRHRGRSQRRPPWRRPTASAEARRRRRRSWTAGNPGFPGFDGQEANNALGETAAAQEAGIPVTYTYLSDVHDDHYNQNGRNAFGPGQAGDVEQLKEYNAAFTAFFQRLANEGIDKTNTLFLVSVDEGDHFAGGAPHEPGL